MLSIRQPTANETPDSGQGGSAVTGNTNTGHASTTASVSGIGSQTKTCRWFSFPVAAFAQILSAMLKFTHTSSGSLSGASPSNTFTVEYTLNGGSNWTLAVSRANFTASQGPTIFSVALPINQNMTQVQVRDFMEAFGGDAGDSASSTVTISDIQIEVVTLDGGAIVIM